jgi:integrase
MHDHEISAPTVPEHSPWNKGKLIGAKPPLRPKHVWSIRTKLQVEGRIRELAMFNLAIDSKLRGCDVVALKVEGIAPHGYAVDRATVRQRKTGQPVRFEVTEQTRQAVDDYIRVTGKKSGEFLFVSRRRGLGRCMTTRQYAVSGLILACSAPTHYAEPKPRSSIDEPATCVPFSCCLAIPKSKAPFAI